MASSQLTIPGMIYFLGGVRTNCFYADEGLIGEYAANGAELQTYGHHLVRDVLVDLPGRDMIRDFLTEETAGFRGLPGGGTHAPVLQLVAHK